MFFKTSILNLIERSNDMENNIKNVPFRISKELHTAFKTQVAKDQTNMNTKLTELVEQYLQKEENK